jgi:hypothetical protein
LVFDIFIEKFEPNFFCTNFQILTFDHFLQHNSHCVTVAKLFFVFPTSFKQTINIVYATLVWLYTNIWNNSWKNELTLLTRFWSSTKIWVHTCNSKLVNFYVNQHKLSQNFYLFNESVESEVKFSTFCLFCFFYLFKKKKKVSTKIVIWVWKAKVTFRNQQID